MNTIKEIMLGTVTGLVLLGAGAAYAGKNEAIVPAITAQQAMEIAQSSEPGHVHELELEREDRVLAWEVELVSSNDGMGYEFLIDATTGEVIEMETEADGDWIFSGTDTPNQH